ncbi:MAG: esterase, partial [Candidatus Nanopelagicales bacterium]
MSIQSGASPFSAAGGRVGVLLCHGFTGSPASMRPWADQLAESGLSVELPLLPGHGTTWQDMQKTTWLDWYGAVDQAFMRLSARCD